MASNREILEAQGYNRKRLVTAFSSGVPGGRELTTRSPFTPLIVGAALVLVMLAIAAIMGRFAPVLPANWENSTLIVVKGTGARYYTINGTLRPVTNITSAKLLSEPGDYKTSEIDAGTIDGIARGTQVGVLGVPDDVPKAASLHSDLWTTCATPSGTHTWVATTPSGATSRDATVVTSAGRTWLLSGGVRHEVAADQVGPVLFTLELDGRAPREVTAQWLDTFEEGSPLTPLELENPGAAVAGLPPSLGTAKLGSVIEVSGDATQQSARAYLVVGDRTITPLTDLALRLYRISKAGQAVGSPLKATVADVADLTVTDKTPYPADWPATVADSVPLDDFACSQLVKDDYGKLRTTLVSLSSADLARALQGTEQQSGQQSGAAATENGQLPAGDSVTVRGGSGALVQANAGGTLGAVMLVSDAGTIHGFGEDPSTTLGRLGYTQSDVLPIPAAWTALIPEGSPLDPAGVWATVGRQ
ncbi:type VII secretion protein EccB [Schaalia sp. 19OD2882]|uniref:type VII secretion protein EccB n=1 Tax=Schaalia sp. 19OD2882 TaxID=2794089 RepID=UPI001C1F0BB6|nr:type VII secretion protein EccB [Schaalia sp. 19OD2882]QWW19826.1 type VII secretion protein EccB [Schaalia sp. 19OD2882]